LNSEIEKLRSELEQKKRNYKEVLKRIHDAHQDAMRVQLNELNGLRDENNNLRYWITVLETGIELLQETTGVTIMNLN
ncbi:33564_t:CDS:1, partial [Gigaspora margarita]